MASSSGQSSTKSKNKNPAFVPSPRWLSESPAFQGTPAEVDYAGRLLSGHSQEPTFSRHLKSPIPPPPANLYPGSPAAFNVDPGIPFLATAGPTDAGSSENGSIQEESPRERRSVGGLVTGIKKAVRRSLRDRTRGQQPDQSIYTQPPQFRDSGYGSSTPQLAVPPTGVLSPIPDYHSSPLSSRRTAHSARPLSETLLGHPEGKFGRDEATVVGHQQIAPPESILSPVSAEPEYGSDYVQMIPPTPPPSDTSLNTYIKRVKKAVKDVNNLPWVAKERVTADYYPERSRRADQPKHHPAIAWRSDAFTQPNYHTTFGTPALSDVSDESGLYGSMANLRAAHRRSRGTMDLDAEFDATPARTPLPQNPPYVSPSYGRMGGLPTDTLGMPPVQRPTPGRLPPGSILLQSGPPLPLPPTPENPSFRRWQNPTATPSKVPSPPMLHNPAITPAQSQTRLASQRAYNYSSVPGEWEEYPREMNGYVPYQFAENFYGSQYGPGVHAARPPLTPPPVSMPSSTTSLRRPA